MRIRRRSKGAHPAGEPQVLSTPEHALAPPPPPRKRRKVTSVKGDRKRTPPGGHPSTGDVINAYWQKSDLVLVLPDASKKNGVRFQRQSAEHSCFIKREDLDDPDDFVRLLNHHHAVRKAIWEGDWLRVVWQNRDMLKVYCKSFHSDKNGKGESKTPIPTYEGMVSPVLRYMADNDLKPSTPRRVWVDLETDSDVPFSQAIEGEARILSWATEDEFGNRESAILTEDTDADEERILRKLWGVFDNYDQIMAWGGNRFDFPIIKARSTLHKLLRGSERDWRRWLWLDHLDLYKRMAMASAESGDEKQSMGLNAVAVSLGIGEKDDFDASQTKQAWENATPCPAGECKACRSCLLTYNIQDTALMPLIEEQTGFITLLQTVADTCGTFPDSRGSKPGVQVEGFLARLALEQGHKFPTVLKARTGETYEGAYVLHPEKKAGIHLDVHVADFAALYPSIIETWNMCPSTIIEGGVDPSMVQLQEEHKSWPDAHSEFEGREPFAYSPLTKQGFRTGSRGILPLAVTQLLQLRKKWNDAKSAAVPGTDEWKDADRRSSAYKITANSFYGVIGDTSSRHYDRRVAESVTQCGKWLILETLKAAELRGMKVIYGDTDSLFVEGATREEFEEFCQWCNAELYPRILNEQGCVTNTVKLAYEKQFRRLIITTAKKYVGSYVHYKGTDADASSKPEIKGLEFKRGDSLRLTRRFQEEVAYRMVGYQTDEDPDDVTGFEEVCARWLDKVMEDRFDVDDITVSKKLNKPLDEYQVANPMVRIAREMEARGEDVAEGARIQYVIIDASVSPQVVQTVEEYDPDGDSLDRMALWDKQIWPATERLLETRFPEHSWERFAGLVKGRKAVARAKVRAEKQAVKDAERAAKKAVKDAARETKAAEKAAEKAEKARLRNIPTRTMRRRAAAT